MTDCRGRSSMLLYTHTHTQTSVYIHIYVTHTLTHIDRWITMRYKLKTKQLCSSTYTQCLHSDAWGQLVTARFSVSHTRDKTRMINEKLMQNESCCTTNELLWWYAPILCQRFHCLLLIFFSLFVFFSLLLGLFKSSDFIHPEIWKLHLAMLSFWWHCNQIYDVCVCQFE